MAQCRQLAAARAWCRLLIVLLLVLPSLAQARPPLHGVPPQQLAAGGAHSLLLRADGTLYAWGLNAFGQLGDGTLTSRAAPVPVALGAAPTSTRFTQVSASATFSLALATTGIIYSWGLNSRGQLGDNSATDRSAPVAVALGAAPAGTRFIQISAGDGHSLALAADGMLYAWGTNTSGQLGDGTTVNRLAPVAVALGAAPAGTHFIQVSAGYQHSLALAADGSLYAWGYNGQGRLGTGNLVSSLTPAAVLLGAAPAGTRFTQVSAGANQSLALAADGTAYAWGSNSNGELGDNSTSVRLTPVAVAPGAAPAGTRFVQVSTEGGHALALAADGTVYAWGNNAQGRLGDNSTTNRLAPVAVAPGTAPAGTRFTQVAAGGLHSLALAADGALYAWGDNNNGEVGDGTTTQRNTPVAVAAGVANGYSQVSIGYSHSLALRTDGTLFGWGNNSNGQLGDATTTSRLTPVAAGQGPVLAGTRFVQVAAGSSCSVALGANGNLYSWGGSSYGQLGNGTTATQAVPVAVAQGAAPVGTRFVQVAAGDGHSLALTADGTLYAWGYNGNGQLGDGTYLNRLTPVAVALGAAPAGTRFVQVAVGAAHSLALAADGTLYAWGNNDGNGRLGDGTTTGRITPVAVALGAAPAGTRFVQVSAGTNHSLALAADGLVYAWGDDSYGQLGDNAVSFRQLAPVAVVPGAAPAGTRFVQVAAGEYHSLALAADGALYTWGGNANGQLGDNSFTQRNTPVQESSSGAGWTAIAAGSFVRHSMAIGAQGAVFSAGSNRFGQLGDGSTTDSPVFVRNRAPLPVRATATGATAFAVYPNPAPGAATVSGLPAKASLTVLDALGRAVAHATTDAAGTARLVLPAGLYVVRSGSASQRLVVE